MDIKINLNTGENNLHLVTDHVDGLEDPKKLRYIASDIAEALNGALDSWDQKPTIDLAKDLSGYCRAQAATIESAKTPATPPVRRKASEVDNTRMVILREEYERLVERDKRLSKLEKKNG